MKHLLTSLAVLAMLASSAAGQTVTGAITGTVLDTAALPLLGAEVRVTHDETGTSRVVRTDAAGEFQVGSLLPGRYTALIQADGFKTYRHQNINLTANERLSIGRITLAVGAVVESVTVKAEGAVVEIESAERSGVMTSDQMTMLMSRDRNMLTLLNTIPGTVGSDENNFENRATPSFSGVPNNMNAITVDGLMSNGVSNPQFFNSGINMDAVSEVKVLINNYKAEYGRNGGAVITAVSKTGTSDFHGSLYRYQRNESLNANYWFNNLNGVQRPIYRYGTLGFTLGGPIYWPGKFNSHRDKLFFFFSEDMVSSRTPTNLSQWTVPTELERRGDFSQTLDVNNRLVVINDPFNNKTPFPGNVIPANRINPNSQKLLSLFPLPNFFDRTISRGNYNYNFQESLYSPVHQEVIRVDYNATNKLRLYFRGNTNYTPSTGYTANAQFTNWPLVKTMAVWTNPSAVISGSYTATPTLVAEFSVGIQGARIKNEPADGSDFSAIDRFKLGINLPQIYPGNNPLNVVPSTTFGGVTNAANIAPRGDFPDRFWGPRAPITASVTKVASAHTFKAGLYHEWVRYYRRGQANFNGTFAFGRDGNNPYDTNWAYSNALLGVFQSYSEASFRPTYYLKGQVDEWYLQDTWKATRRLTLDYGMRFTWFQPYYQGDGKAQNFDPESYDPRQAVTLYRPVMSGGKRMAQDPFTGEILSPSFIGAIVPGHGNAKNGMVLATDPSMPKGFIENRGVHYGPRIGIAYALTSDNKTALRAGFGIAYMTHTNAGTSTPPVDNMAVTPTIYNATFDTFNPGQGVLFPTSITARPLSVKTPSMYSYSIGIQRAVGFGTVVDVAYVATLGRNIAMNQQLNTLPYGARFLPENYDETTKKPLPDNYFRPYPGYVNVTVPQTVSSNYHSLQTQLNRRFARRLQYGVAWTWSKTMGYSGTFPTYLSNDLNYGKTSLDRTHTLTFNWLYDIPRVADLVHVKPMGWLLNDWQVSGIAYFQSGRPFSVSYSNDFGEDWSGGGDWTRPNVIRNANLPRGERTFYRFFDTSAFVAPEKYTPGNSPVDVVRGPGRNNWDISLFKNFRVERVRFQLRGEFYNAFNHPSFYTMDTSARFDRTGKQVNGRFGQLTDTRQPRFIQLALRINF